MTIKDLEALLTAMLQSGDGVSDCLFVNGKPPLIERYGKLHELPMEESDAVLQPAHIDAMAALLMAEVNVHFTYPLLTHPRGFAALALHVDDTDCASSVLLGEGFKLLSQADISR